MLAAIGLIVLFAMVFGGFALTGGHLGPVLHGIPHEMLVIGGAAAGSPLPGTASGLLKSVGGGLVQVFKGRACKKPEYADRSGGRCGGTAWGWTCRYRWLP